MADSIQTKATLKGYFETGDFPTQQEFADLIETLVANADSGGTRYTYTEVTGATNIDATHHIIGCAGTTNYTVTLPTAVNVSGREYTIVNVGTGVITVATTSSQTIAGATTRTLGIQYNALLIVSDGANWQLRHGTLPHVAHAMLSDTTTQTILDSGQAYPVRFNTTEDILGMTHGLTSEVTITIANPGVIAWPTHTLLAGDSVIFTTTGALPTGLTAGTAYYVVSPIPDSGHFSVADRPGGTAIQTTGTQSGTHTATSSHRLYAESAGDYEFIVSAIGNVTTGNNKHFDMWFRKNRSDVDRSNTKLEFPSANVEQLLAVATIFELAVGDFVEVMWASDSTAAQLLYTATQASPTRPATPSIILIAKKISL